MRTGLMCLDGRRCWWWACGAVLCVCVVVRYWAEQRTDLGVCQLGKWHHAGFLVPCDGIPGAGKGSAACDWPPDISGIQLGGAQPATSGLAGAAVRTCKITDILCRSSNKHCAFPPISSYRGRCDGALSGRHGKGSSPGCSFAATCVATEPSLPHGRLRPSFCALPAPLFSSTQSCCLTSQHNPSSLPPWMLYSPSSTTQPATATTADGGWGYDHARRGLIQL
jgi:hypothetical protein